jgi:hypothetical protein
MVESYIWASIILLEFKLEGSDKFTTGSYKSTLFGKEVMF